MFVVKVFGVCVHIIIYWYSCIHDGHLFFILFGRMVNI